MKRLTDDDTARPSIRRDPMAIPFVIDNQEHRLADVLNDLLAQTLGKPLDIATAYFSISGYRLVKQGLHQVGAFRLLLGSEPHSGVDVVGRYIANQEPHHEKKSFFEELKQLVERYGLEWHEEENR